ncbi:MAG: hypothetical protein MZU97_26265 [Bacillus subtilis]|nr:hypothetical protein [Bacillus subtilis]
MKKVLGLVMMLLVALGVTACGGETTATTTTTAGTSTTVSTSATTTTTTAQQTVDLVINVAGENDKRLFTYLQANPLEMPDGKIINSGDLKPMWQYVETRINLNITDVAVAGQRPTDMIDSRRREPIQRRRHLWRTQPRPTHYERRS